jgi:hypothetical protein
MSGTGLAIGIVATFAILMLVAVVSLVGDGVQISDKCMDAGGVMVRSEHDYVCVQRVKL